MPSTSPKQKRLMAAVAHNKKFAAEVGIPQSVGREFYRADQEKARKNTIKRAFNRAKG
jgi:hypothetical protein